MMQYSLGRVSFRFWRHDEFGMFIQITLFPLTCISNRAHF